MSDSTSVVIKKDFVPILITICSIGIVGVSLYIAFKTGDLFKKFKNVDHDCTDSVREDWDGSLKVLSIILGFLMGSLTAVFISSSKPGFIKSMVIFVQSISVIGLLYYIYNQIIYGLEQECKDRPEETLRYFVSFGLAFVAGGYSRPVIEKIGGQSILYSVVSLFLGFMGLLLAYQSTLLTKKIYKCVSKSSDDEKFIKLTETELTQVLEEFNRAGIALSICILIVIVVLVRSLTNK